jgi:hypothetical protein
VGNLEQAANVEHRFSKTGGKIYYLAKIVFVSDKTSLKINRAEAQPRKLLELFQILSPHFLNYPPFSCFAARPQSVCGSA